MSLAFAWVSVFVARSIPEVRYHNKPSILTVSRMFPGLVLFNKVASRLLNVTAGQLGFFGIEVKCLSPDKGELSAETQRKDNKMKRPETAAEFHDHTKNQSQLQKTSYARELRAVGQALEARHVVSLDLELK